MKKFWITKIVGFILCGIAAVALFSYIVMLLWNGILVAVLGVKVISFCQALGILALSKILFGGFHGEGNCKGRQWKDNMKEKWQHMNPEDREKFKEEMRNRCSSWRRNSDTIKGGAE